MDFTIKRLTADYEKSYMEFVLGKKESLIYYSLKYRDLITDLLNDKSEYLIAVKDEKVVGCLPIFFRESEQYGMVANSLPYYGGHGGVLADSDSVRIKLLEEYINLLKSKGCVASTLVGSPLEDYDSIYQSVIMPDYIDERIELMTYFPYQYKMPYSDALMNSYHYKVRNVIRKAIKSSVKVKVDNSEESIEFLYETHKENMIAIGGLPKERRFFKLIPTYFKPGDDYNVYVAHIGNQLVAAMLVFYFTSTVEYYTPVIVSEFRNYQPLSLIIYTAMQDAMERGFEKWNWGGTSLNQTSLYTFKSRWGTTETRYYYYTKIWENEVMQIAKDDLLKIFSNYFVYPFNQVEADEQT